MNVGGATMFHRLCRLPALLLALLLLPGPAALAEPSESRVVVPVEGGFEEVRGYLLDAIAAEGLVVSYTAHVQTMLQRTAEATGATGRIYGDAQVVEFCSAALTLELLQDDPHAIVQCPYRIAVYTLDGEPETTYLAYPRPTFGGTSGPLEAVEALLATIVEASQ